MNFLNKLMLKIITNPSKRADYLRKMGYLIGQKTQIYPGVSFGSEPYLIKIGNNSKITLGVSFITHDGGMHVIRNLYNGATSESFGHISIGDNVFIGNKTLILPGVKIGHNCIVGAGSVVTKSFENNSVIAGIPARRICSIEDYYEKNNFRFVNTKHLSSNEKKIVLLNDLEIQSKIIKEKV